MLTFALTIEGLDYLADHTGVSSIAIDEVQLFNGADVIKTITNFTGNLVLDESDIGAYFVLSFEDTSNSAYTVTKIKLTSSTLPKTNDSFTAVAESETVSVVKAANKVLKVRVSGTGTGTNLTAIKLFTFNQISINLPYATSIRDGIIRFAKDENETDKSHTVYSASKIDSIIEANNGTQYVTWDSDGDGGYDTGHLTVTNLTITNDYEPDDESYRQVTFVIDDLNTEDYTVLTFDGRLGGDCVTSEIAFDMTSGALLGIQAENKLLTDTTLASIYATAFDDNDNAYDGYLASVKSVKSYVDSRLSDVNTSDCVHLEGEETISGAKTFTAGITSNSYSGDGVYSTYNATTWTSATTALPTASSVKSAISASQTSLQSQIDALNAGQNLADIVDTKTQLVAHSLTDLKAAGDTKPDSENTFSVGDKVQVLHDTTVLSGDSEGIYDDSTADKIAAGIATVYELKKGTKSTTDKKDIASATTGYYWHYIGTYGCNGYSKSEADSKYVAKNSLESTITNTSPTNNAPSANAVYTAINGLSDSYVTIATEQNITGEKSFSNTVNIKPTSTTEYSYISLGAAGGSSTVSALDSISFVDIYKMGMSSIAFSNQRNGLGTSLQISTDKYNEKGDSVLGHSGMYQIWGQHYYNYSSDCYMTTATGLPSEEGGVPGAWTDFAIDYLSKNSGNTAPVENYVDRIRIRRTTSLIDDSTLLYNGTHTFIDLFADHINTVGKDIHFNILVNGTPSELLKITSADGVYSTNFTGGYKINGTAYSFGTAGSLTYETSISSEGTSAADDTHIPTSKAVKDYVDAATSTGPSVSDISEYDAVGSIGFFAYYEAGAAKGMGSTVLGQYLKPVGISLPMSGQLSYTFATPVPALTGTWKLLSLAPARTATEPCLVLAQKIIGDSSDDTTT